RRVSLASYRLLPHQPANCLQGLSQMSAEERLIVGGLAGSLCDIANPVSVEHKCLCVRRNTPRPKLPPERRPYVGVGGLSGRHLGCSFRSSPRIFFRWTNSKPLTLVIVATSIGPPTPRMPTASVCAVMVVLMMNVARSTQSCKGNT